MAKLRLVVLANLCLGGTASRASHAASSRKSALSNPGDGRLASHLATRSGGASPETVDLAVPLKPTSKPATLAFNLINNVAGAGLLTLSAGMVGIGYLPAGAIGVGLGLVSAYTFSLIGACCEELGVDDFRGLWSLTIGEKSSFTIDLAIAFNCVAVCVIYSGLIADISTSLGQSLGGALFQSRSLNLMATTGVVLLPLCLLKSLAALGFTSLMGLGAVLLTAGVVIKRFLDGSYAPGGALLETLEASQHPALEGASLLGISGKAFVLASNLGLAYIAHYNAPRMYSELEGRTAAKFSKVVKSAFAVLAFLYVSVMIAGHATFGDATLSNVLSNYSGSDPLAVLARGCTLVSLIVGYPLAFCGIIDGLRGAAAGILTSQGLSEPPGSEPSPRSGVPPKRLKAAVIEAASGFAWPSSMADDLQRLLLVMAVMATALSVTDIGLVVGITGSVIGASIVYVLPSVMALRTAQMNPASSLNAHKNVCRALIPLGAAIGAVGAAETLKAYL